MRKLISGPAIAALHHRTRSWANDHLNRGTFGEIFRSGGIVYAELDTVQRVAGPFSAEQLALAADDKPDRIIILPVERVAA